MIFLEAAERPDDVGPWGYRLDMTTQRWLTVPTRLVPIASLIAMQPGIYFAGLHTCVQPIGGDPYPHVIRWEARHYLEDGHHRVVRAALGCATHVEVRVLDLDSGKPGLAPGLPAVADQAK